MKEGEWFGLKRLGEAILLQSVEDLWSTDHRRQSMDFFGDDVFRLYAKAAGMKVRDRLRFLSLVTQAVDASRKVGKRAAPG